MGTIGLVKRKIFRSVKVDTDDVSGLIKKRLSSPGYFVRKIRSSKTAKTKDVFDKNWNTNAEKYKPYRDRYKGIVVGITGSVGKTTTKQYVGKVLGSEMPVFMSPSNFNRGIHLAKNMETRMNSGYKAFIMECGADVPGTVRDMAGMLRPNIAIVTNVKAHHLSEYGTIENVFADKIQMVESLEPGGTAIVNMDDAMLAGYDYKCNVVTMGIECEADVDFRVVNVQQQGGTLSFDILHDGKSTHIESEVIGKENAYNICMAYIAGTIAGVSEENILKGIAGYKSHGSRQNVEEYGGYTLYMDCYNVTNDTIVAAVNNLGNMDVPEGARRIAVIGGENRLGENRIPATEELGRRVAEAAGGRIDEIVCYGNPSDEEDKLNWFGDAPLLYKSIIGNGYKDVRLIRDFSEMAEYLKDNVKKGDAILFKCIVYLNMPIIVDKVFGTYFSINQRIVTKRAQTVSENGYTGFIVPDMDEFFITDVDRKMLRAKKIVIPDTIMGRPVFGIARGLFAYSDAEEIDFGNTIKQIGTGAFCGCGKLKSVTIPDSVLHIKAGAFRDCKDLSKIEMGENVIQIDERAFAGCGN